ncbi:MAG: MBL fold metallo-hydrolase, partial [Fulvivirga sp.]
MRVLLSILLLSVFVNARSQDFEVDKFETTAGLLEITFIGHGSFMMKINDKIIHVDPSTREANY